MKKQRPCSNAVIQTLRNNSCHLSRSVGTFQAYMHSKEIFWKPQHIGFAWILLRPGMLTR